MVQLAVGPVGSQTPASSASLVTQPVSARRRHRPVSTTDTTSTDVSGSQPAKRNTRGSCRQLKTAKDTRVMNSRINIGYDERHRAAPTPELHRSLAHDVGHVVRGGGGGGGSKFPEIDVFGDVYVRPGNELAESLHVKEPIGSSGVRLPASSRDSD
ncbi:unnamed protein product [Prunus brigantina]